MYLLFQSSNEYATTILLPGEKFFLDLKARYDENYNRSYGADFMNQSWTTSSRDTDPILFLIIIIIISLY